MPRRPCGRTAYCIHNNPYGEPAAIGVQRAWQTQRATSFPPKQPTRSRSRSRRRQHIVGAPLGAGAPADDGILYLNEYQYENDLVTDFARLVASPRRRGSLYVAAAIAALIGIGMLVAGGSWIKFGVVLIVFGAFLAWWSKNLHHTLARDFIEAVEADESMGGRYRRVAANEDGLMVWGKSGKSQFFPFEKLDHVLDGERIFVAMFADQGVTIPKDTFVRGDAEQFGPFLKARINKKLRIETKRKKMKAEKAAAEAKQGDQPKKDAPKQRKQKKNKKKH